MKSQAGDPKTKGFTLIEVMVAVAILSFGLLGIANLMIQCIHTNKTSSERTVATMLAQKKMEEIRQMAYHGLGPEGTTSTEAYRTMPDHPFFQRVVSVSSVPGLAGAKTVTITVSWKYPYHQSVELKTILSR